MPSNITTDEKLEVLVTLGADEDTLMTVMRVMSLDSFDQLCNELVGVYMGEGNTWDLFRWLDLKRHLEGIFA